MIHDPCLAYTLVKSEMKSKTSVEACVVRKSSRSVLTDTPKIKYFFFTGLSGRELMFCFR